jgi:hypothetical protein
MFDIPDAPLLDLDDAIETLETEAVALAGNGQLDAADTVMRLADAYRETAAVLDTTCANS